MLVGPSIREQRIEHIQSTITGVWKNTLATVESFGPEWADVLASRAMPGACHECMAAYAIMLLEAATTIAGENPGSGERFIHFVLNEFRVPRDG